MLMWSIFSYFFTLFTMGNLVSPSESSTIRFQQLQESPLIIKTDKFCFDFKSCPGDKPYRDLSDIEIFQQIFCPSQEKFQCLEEFGRRCITSDSTYFYFLLKVVDKSISRLNHQLCSNGPYKKELLKHAICIGSLCRSIGSPITVSLSADDIKKGADDYGLKALRDRCGNQTESFFKENMF